MNANDAWADNFCLMGRVPSEGSTDPVSLIKTSCTLHSLRVDVSVAGCCVHYPQDAAFVLAKYGNS